MRAKSGLKGVLAVGAVAGAVVAARVTLARRRLMGPVLPELRHPLLLVPVHFGPGTLRLIRRVPVPPGPVVPGVDVEQRTVPAGEDHPAVTVFVYDGADRSRTSGALLWIHGGGYVLGHPATYHELCSRFAVDLGIVVVSVDYRLAPEHPFPTPRGLLRRPGLAGRGPRGRPRPGSRSVGPAPAGAWPRDWPSWLGSGARSNRRSSCWSTRCSTTGPPSAPTRRHRSPVDPAATPSAGPPTRAPARRDEDRPYAVPARREDLTGLPPAWIGVGNLDLFHDEDVAYAERLRAAGVECKLDVVEGAFHAADAFFRTSPAMNTFRATRKDALSAALTPI